MEEEFLDFIKDIESNYDCDEDAHTYNTRCRCCEAKKLILKYETKEEEKKHLTGTKKSVRV